MMNQYHKIQTVFLRDPETKHKTLLEGQWALPEFEYLKDLEWAWTEKVDGTNVRVILDEGVLRFGGKSNAAQMPTFLLAKLQDMFSAEALDRVFRKPEDALDPADRDRLAEHICLYGEGYGAKIQKGGGDYIPDGVDFILFDVNINGVWLTQEAVGDIAQKLQCEIVPVVGTGTLCEAVEFCRANPISLIAPNRIMEGLVMRPKIELQDRRGNRIISKIKVEDFAK